MAAIDAVRCLECDIVGMTHTGTPGEPEDPDRWGNVRVPFKCPGCSARGSVVFGRHGGSLVEGKEFRDAGDSEAR